MTDNSLTNDEIEKLGVILWHYLYPEYRRLCDFESVVTERTPLIIDGVQCYMYDCPCQPIYLNTNNYPVTYKKQVINIDENSYFYDITEDGVEGVMDKITTYEWKRNNISDG